VEEATGPDHLDRIFAETRERGNEGLMVKDPLSPYTPGRRGLAWLKLKRPLATLDVVVTAVEWGHGKRKGVLSTTRSRSTTRAPAGSSTSARPTQD